MILAARVCYAAKVCVPETPRRVTRSISLQAVLADRMGQASGPAMAG